MKRRGVGPGRTRRHGKTSRTLPVKGKGDDRGRFFRCWHCGFVCDKERDSLGGDSSMAAVTSKEAQIPAQYGYREGDNERSARIMVDGINFRSLGISRQQADGNAYVVRHDFDAEVYGGCPMCGTLNWKGDY